MGLLTCAGCWLQCHTMTINAVHSVENDPLGNYEAIGNNCKDEVRLVSSLSDR